MSEDLDFEYKSNWDGTPKEWLVLVQTIVSIANSAGGEIRLEGVSVDLSLLDSARIHDQVQKYIRPRIDKLSSDATGPNAVTIRVDESENAPHIFVLEGTYQVGREHKTIFHKGQVYARHSSKTEPANDQDIERIIAKRVSKFLGRLADSVALTGLSPAVEANLIITEDATSQVLRSADVATHYPFLAKDIAIRLEKTTDWIQTAAAKLGIKDDQSLSFTVNGSSGKPVQRRYAKAAEELIRAKLVQEPNWNPYKNP